MTNVRMTLITWRNAATVVCVTETLVCVPAWRVSLALRVRGYSARVSAQGTVGVLLCKHTRTTSGELT